MDLDAYVAEHGGQWRRLEQLANRRRLSAAEADELIALYQRATTHLSVIRSSSPDPALLARLSRLILEARGAITGSRAFRWSDLGRFFTVSFPVTVYRARAWWLTVMAASFVLSGVIMAWVATHPETQRALLSDDAIGQLVGHDFEAYYSEHPAQDFALHVWANNAKLAAIYLAAGVLIVPVVYFLWENALGLGLSGGIMIGHGRGELFFSLIAPHGLLELTCCFVSAGIGLRIGWSWIAPRAGLARARALAETARSGMTGALGLAVVLLLCACIEAFVTPFLPTVLAVAIGLAAWGGFFAYVFVLGRRAADAGETGDVDSEEREAFAPSV